MYDTFHNLQNQHKASNTKEPFILNQHDLHLKFRTLLVQAIYSYEYTKNLDQSDFSDQNIAATLVKSVLFIDLTSNKQNNYSLENNSNNSNNTKNDDYCTSSEFFQSLLKQYISDIILNIQEIDQIIIQALSIKWRYERIAKIIQSVLRVGAYEMRRLLLKKTLIELPQNPPHLNISEELAKENKQKEVTKIIKDYLKITKTFNHQNDLGFVNVLLDNFKNHYSKLS